MLRKLVIVLMLLAAPFAQVKGAFACTMLGGAVVERCCCETPCGDLPCPELPAAVEQESCCVPVVDMQADAALSAKATPADEKRDPSTPDIAPLPAAPPQTSNRLRARPLGRVHAGFSAGSHTYLKVARLRL